MQTSKVNRRGAVIMSLVTAAIVSGIVIPLWLLPPDSSATSRSSKKTTSTDVSYLNGSLQKGTPTFSTVLPAGHSIADYGGWTRVSPPNRDPVYAYTDHIGVIPINVSQQPIPKDFGDDPASQVRDIATGFGASRTLTAGTTTIYVGTSTKGPESVILSKNNLLILIKATAAIADNELVNYIQSLG